MTKDMTQGSPLKLILQFALPLLFGNLFQQAYNMVDAAIVGQYLGSNALASVGVSSSIQFLVIGFCLGICTGFAVPVAQAFGAKDMDHLRQYIYIGSILTVLIAAFVTALTASLTPQILHLLKTPDEIFHGAWQYLFIIFLGIPFTMLYNLCSGILRAVGDSRTPFLFLVLSSILNIGLDLFTIIVLKWGVAGAAAATIFSQAVSGVLCLILMLKRFTYLVPSKENRVWNQAMARRLLTMGIPMGLQFSITAIGSMVMQGANNSLGTVYVSAFASAMKIKQFCMCPFDALSTGVSTFASQNYGAGFKKRIHTGLKQGVLVGVLYGAAIGVVMIFFGRYMSMLFIPKTDTKVLDASAQYVACVGSCFWMLGILNVVRLTVQGLGYSGRAIFSGVFEMFARSLMGIFAVPVFKFWGICFSDQVAWVAAICYIVPTMFYVLKKIDKVDYKAVV
jgi:putative MATE family efflux protein